MNILFWKRNSNKGAIAAKPTTPIQAEWAKDLPTHQMISRKRILISQLSDIDVPNSEKEQLKIKWAELTGVDFDSLTLEDKMDLSMGQVRAQRIASQLSTPFVHGDRRNDLLSEYRRLTGLDFSEVHGS